MVGAFYAHDVPFLDSANIDELHVSAAFLHFFKLQCADYRNACSISGLVCACKPLCSAEFLVIDQPGYRGSHRRPAQWNEFECHVEGIVDCEPAKQRFAQSGK